MEKYYNGAKLLSMKDINGERPEIYLCTSNRSAGKTTYFNRLCVNRFIKHNEKFMLIYRFNYELSDCANNFFKEIQKMFFADYEIEGKTRARGKYVELYLNGKSCGYGVALNDADNLKKLSHYFADVKRMLMDEFQSETNHYCNDEVKKFISLHTSVARGGGEQIRYVPVYMISNPVSIINPYYTELGISERLNDNTNFLRGDGFVLEQGFNESASTSQKESGFNRAFKKNEYIGYAAECVYLNDNKSFIEKPRGEGRYICTLRYKNAEYGIREYVSEGVIYCDNKPDLSNKNKITVTTEDHEINYVMLKRNDFFLTNLRYFFERGCFRFKDLKCKEAVLKALSY